MHWVLQACVEKKEKGKEKLTTGCTPIRDRRDNDLTPTGSG